MYANLYKNKGKVTTREVAEHLFDFVEKLYKKSSGNVLDIPVLKSETPQKKAKISFEYYCLLHSMITIIAWNSLDATKNQRNNIVRSYFEKCQEHFIKKSKNEQQAKLRFNNLKLRRNSYGKAYLVKTKDNPFFNCGQLFRKIYDLIQYYSDPEADKAGLSEKDIANMPNWWLEKYIQKDNTKETEELSKVKENINIPFQTITVTFSNELKKLISEAHKEVTIVDES